MTARQLIEELNKHHEYLDRPMLIKVFGPRTTVTNVLLGPEHFVLVTDKEILGKGYDETTLHPPQPSYYAPHVSF